MENYIFRPVFNRKKRALEAEDKAPIHIYCYLGPDDKHRRYIPTGILVCKADWDERRHRVRNSHHNQIKYNQRLIKMVNDLEELMLTTVENTGIFRAEDLDRYANKDDANSFISFLEREVREDSTVAPGTTVYRKAMIRRLEAAVGDITLKALRYDTIERFDKALASEGLQVSTIQKYHRQLRKFIGVAIKKGLVKDNPYDDFRVRRPPRSLRKCLWHDDLDALWALSYSNMYDVVRLKFLFSCYTGLRISDVSALKWDDLRNGKIILKMKKTGQPVIIPLGVLSDRPNEILEMMKDKDAQYVFPRLSDQVTNRELKRIGMDAGIPFPLTFHVSRHTFCTMVAHNTGSVFKVMEYAGIYKVDTAMTYINLARMFAD